MSVPKRAERLCFKRREKEREKNMDVELILKVAGLSLIITVVCQIMSRAGREEMSTMLSLSGMVMILLLIAERIAQLINTLRGAFGL